MKEYTTQPLFPLSRPDNYTRQWRTISPSRARVRLMRAFRAVNEHLRHYFSARLYGRAQLKWSIPIDTGPSRACFPRGRAARRASSARPNFSRLARIHAAFTGDITCNGKTER